MGLSGKLLLPSVLMSIVLLTGGMHCAHSGTRDVQACRLKPGLCSLMADWKRDAGGCLHIRTFRMAKNIVDSLPDELLNLDSMRLYLGPADKSNSSTHYNTLEYYYNSVCAANVPVDSTDKQWIEFVFDAQTRKFRSVAQYAQ